MQDLGRPGNELMAAAVVSSKLVYLPPRCKRKQNDASTIDSRGTALVTQAQYRESSPKGSGYGKKPAAKKILQISQGQKLCCPISELHDAVDFLSQLECISPPVGRPTTCMVTL